MIHRLKPCEHLQPDPIAKKKTKYFTLVQHSDATSFLAKLLTIFFSHLRKFSLSEAIIPPTTKIKATITKLH